MRTLSGGECHEHDGEVKTVALSVPHHASNYLLVKLVKFVVAYTCMVLIGGNGR